MKSFAIIFPLDKFPALQISNQQQPIHTPYLKPAQSHNGLEEMLRYPVKSGINSCTRYIMKTPDK
jgi:hypothetical protein